MKNQPYKYIKWLLVGLVSIILIPSCLVTKKYERPENFTTKELYRIEQQEEELLELETISWEDFFGDSLLVKLINKGLENNIDIKMALQNIEKTEAYLKQGKANFYPSLELNAQYSNQKFSEGSSTGEYLSRLEQYNLSGMVSWELDIWGKIRSTKRMYEASFLESIETRKAVQTRIIADIATAYYTLTSLQSKLRISDETIKNREKSLEFNKELKSAGIQNELIVEKSKALLLMAKAIKQSIISEIQIQENAICILLGETPHEIKVSKLEQQEINPEWKIGVPANLLRNRPDVKSAEFNLIAAFENVNVSRANLYPSLTLSASGGYQNRQIENWFNPTSVFYNFLGGLTQPVFNRRINRTTLEVAKSEQDLALLQFQITLLTAGQEVSDALNQFQTASSLIEVKEGELESYQRIAEFSEDLFSSGLINAIEIINAEENVLSTSLEIIDQKNAQLSSLIRLYQALGGGAVSFE